MQLKPIGRAATALFLIACLDWSAGVQAVEFGNEVELHGYGSQDYLQADHNVYLGADNRGTWGDNFLALVGTVTLNDKAKLWAQLETSSGEATRFTWFFVDYQLNDTIRFHVGRVKYPLGLYNETIDAKFIQVTSLEPAIYQAAADFVHDAYTGAGVDYTQTLGNAGEITWQVYGGNTFDTTTPEDTRDRRAYGGRVTYRTPVDGLRFMASGYKTDVEVLTTRAIVSETRVIGSLDFVRGNWDVKSEFAKHDFLGVTSKGYYGQLGYSIGTRWMPFVRYDHVDADESRSASDSISQKIFVFGLNYKLLSNISLRVEDHLNRGYALPVASGEVPVGQGTRNWNLFVAGVHFMF